MQIVMAGYITYFSTASVKNISKLNNGRVASTPYGLLTYALSQNSC